MVRDLIEQFPCELIVAARLPTIIQPLSLNHLEIVVSQWLNEDRKFDSREYYWGSHIVLIRRYPYRCPRCVVQRRIRRFLSGSRHSWRPSRSADSGNLEVGVRLRRGCGAWCRDRRGRHWRDSDSAGQIQVHEKGVLSVASHADFVEFSFDVDDLTTFVHLGYEHALVYQL